MLGSGLKRYKLTADEANKTQFRDFGWLWILYESTV